MWLIITLSIVLIIVGLVYPSRDPLRVYKDKLGLKKAALVYSQDFTKLKETILPVRKSVFSRIEPTIWLYETDSQQIFLTANYKKDVRIWLQPKTVLSGIHIVLDSVKNNTLKRTNLIKDKFPNQKIDLEGDFPNHFKLYCGEGQQIIALQIISPDIMSYVVDEMLDLDIEIADNQVAMISRKSASSEQKLIATIKTALLINKLAAAATKVTTL